MPKQSGKKLYRLTRESVWFARKSGQPEGYGATPEAAFASANRKAKQKLRAAAEKQSLLVQLENLGELQNKFRFLQGRCRQLEDRCRELETRKDLGEHDRLEGLVMMAMIRFDTKDPFCALQHLNSRGILEYTKGIAAAESVQTYREKWEEIA